MTSNDRLPDDDRPAYQPSREELEDYEAALLRQAEQDCDCENGEFYWDDQDRPPHRVNVIDTRLTDSGDDWDTEE